MSQDRKGVPYARERVEFAIAQIENRAHPSPFRDEVVAVLKEAVHNMRRNRHKVGKARRVSRPMDREKVMAIKLLIAANPAAANKTIADRVGVQAGRVTEVRAGKYDHLLSPELRNPVSPADDFFQMPLGSKGRAA